MRIEMHKECYTFEDAKEAMSELQELIGLVNIERLSKGVKIDVVITNEF